MVLWITAADQSTAKTIHRKFTPSRAIDTEPEVDDNCNKIKSLSVFYKLSTDTTTTTV
jgi:hypothetical protein